MADLDANFDAGQEVSPLAPSPEELEAQERRSSWTLLGLSAAMVVVATAFVLGWNALKTWQTRERDPGTAAAKIEKLRAAESHDMNSYDGPWVDPAHEKVRIPIDRAMQLLAEEATSDPARPAPKP